MKKILNYMGVAAYLGVFGCCVSGMRAAGIPDYRGKVVVIVDRTMAANIDVSNKLVRLTSDLVGDGWRVIRHDVERGKDPVTENAAWKKQVKQVRALIKANYDAAPTEIKSVFLVGHVPVPYSGDGTSIVGGHPEVAGAHPADSFYGEMSAPYAYAWSGASIIDATMWTDDVVNNNSTPFPNIPGDGRFDQYHIGYAVPASLNLAVGRADLSGMTAFHIGDVDEAKLVARYLEKNHDFRCGTNGLLVQRRALDAGFYASNVEGGPDNGTFCGRVTEFDAVFGSSSVNHICDAYPHWFPNVSASGQDYLIGYGAGWGWTVVQPRAAAGIGGTSSADTHPQVAWSLNSAQNNFVDFDSRVTFVNFFGSYFGSWDQQNSFLRAPLANPYDPSGGRYGYGLGVVFGGRGLSANALAAKAQGQTIGEAIIGVGETSMHATLMGDPTLRYHTVRQIPSLSATKTTTTVTLTWGASPDAANGYRIYRAPTSKGPFTYVADVGSVTSYVAARPATSDPTYPDNFYMVRAKRTEQPASGSSGISAYDNMSVGAIVKLPSGIPSYNKILSGPANQVAAVGDSVAFSVDSLGVLATGTERFTYQWYKNGVAIPVNHSNIGGGTTNAIIITNAQSGDVGTYSVTVSLIGGGLPKSASATLSLVNNDTYTVVRDTTTSLSVLVNDLDYTGGNANLAIDSLVGSSTSDFGTLSMSADARSFSLNPSVSWLGSFEFTYLAKVGAVKAQSAPKVTVNVVPHSPNQPPTISAIGSQSINVYQTVQIPFTINDSDHTLASDLGISVVCSSSTLLYQNKLDISGTGQNRTLTFKGGAVSGTAVITITVVDWDGGETTRQFSVTVNPVSVPVLVPGVVSGSGLTFSIISPADSVVNVLQSDDLSTWMTMKKVTVSASGSYCYRDDSLATVTHRFYNTRNANGLSVNSLGFSKQLIPKQIEPPGSLPMPGRKILAAPFNSVAGISLQALFPSGLGDSTVQVIKRNLTAPGGYSEDSAVFASTEGGWIDWNTGLPSSMTLSPGEAAYFQNFDLQLDIPVYLTGDLPTGSFGNVLQPSVSFQDFYASSMVPIQAEPTISLGFPAVSGDSMLQWDAFQYDFHAPPPLYSVFSGPPNNTWSPAVRTVEVGEGFCVLSATSSPRTWAQSLSVCPPDVTLVSPAPGIFLVGPVNISLSATATAFPGHDVSHSIATVGFYNGSTLIGQGTLGGGTYNLTWNNVQPGTYTVTARAKDNSVYTGVPNGFTTVSLPVTVTVLASAAPILSAPGLSGNNFTFNVSGQSGVQAQVKATQNGTSWTTLGTLPMTGGTGTGLDSAANTFAYRSYSVVQNGVCAANPQGFVQVSVPGKVNGQGGRLLIANHLNSASGSTLSTLIPSAPEGTVVSKYDANQQNYVTSTFTQGAWCPANMTLVPGEGVMIENATTSPLSLAFTGALFSGTKVTSLASGFTLISSARSTPFTLANLGLPAALGDMAQRYSASLQTYTIAIFDGVEWVDNETGLPYTSQIHPGESFFYLNEGATAKTWTETVGVLCP